MVSQPRVVVVGMLGGPEGRRAAHLFLTDLHRLMTQYVRYSNMTHSGCFLLVFFISWGITAGSVEPLPHVKKYQTVIPQRLKVSSPIHDAAAAHQTFPDVLRYSVTFAEQNHTLHLEKNKDLVGGSFTVTHFTDEGTRVSTAPDLWDHCYYHGRVVGVDDSSASVGLCSGIKGFVRIQDQVYLIEPLADAEADVQGAKHSSEMPSDGGLHAVYNYKHLRRKRSSCSHGNGTTFYDHGAHPSALFQLSSLKSRGQTRERAGKPRTVEMVVVVDHTEYKKFGSIKKVQSRVLEAANHVDKLYRPVGIRVMLVGLDIWSNRDQIDVSSDSELTLGRFLKWRQWKLLPDIKHDNAQFITGVDFDGSTVGLANTNSMCTSNSGAVNEDHNPNPIGVASTIAHEMGHNLGLSHDKENCVCGSQATKRGCIMSESLGIVYPEQFSSCSQQQLSTFLEEINPACLLDTPSTNRLYGGPVCGNAFLEAGEECDCGTVEECTNPCCNATTCKLAAGARCAAGECCHGCQLKPTGSVCREKSGDCDLEEFCTGFSASCPTDAFTQNGLTCNRGRGYCYNGQCPSRLQHCRRLWGPEAAVAADACYLQHGGCRKTLFSQRCSSRDQSCGKLFCSGGWEFPITSKKFFYTLGNGNLCNEAVMNSDDNFPQDLAMVPTGTKCGTNMVCYNQRCQDIKSIKTYGTNDCAGKCSNRGVCNHENKCHCDPGWAPPYCDVLLPELPEETGSMVVMVSLVTSLLLLVLVVGGSICCIKKTRPVKRCLRSAASGRSNPLFQPGSARGSPSLGPTHISQPIFVESSATRACKPLSSSRPTTAAPKPSRAAPEPPKNFKPVARPQQYQQGKPLPPSRPLPPLASKPVTKPKLPVPPVKPKPSAVPSSLPHTQLLAARAALMPPNRPR
ncbi:disintegrin and metalloproteinase domain-containing protein 8a [Takifugu rubripes]|uniref:ADAM metallopeptidase domain 8a n=1 Tax=Takifugu rubripes TaxID=31033 RepID=A0A674P513_TAKRU|nr:disintegrin and metalloproteinase domain-containing protein 8-like [Takifugu rubripes]